MGLCKGGICVNSTFSWFGAYIVNKSNEIIHNNCDNGKEKDHLDEVIIMPSKWFMAYITAENYKDMFKVNHID